MIWSSGQFYKELGVDTMAFLECVLVDPHSSANCERAGRTLKAILPAHRKSLQSIIIDGEMRICMNGPHERAINWSFFSKRWFNVLSKGSLILRDKQERGTGQSQVVSRQKVTSKARFNLECTFYSTIPPCQCE